MSLRSHGLQPTRLLSPWDSPGKKSGLDRHLLLQGIFPTQGWSSERLHCRLSLNTSVIQVLWFFFHFFNLTISLSNQKLIITADFFPLSFVFLVLIRIDFDFLIWVHFLQMRKLLESLSRAIIGLESRFSNSYSSVFSLLLFDLLILISLRNQ